MKNYRIKSFKLVLIAFTVFLFAKCNEQPTTKNDKSEDYKNPELTIEQRVNDLVSRMTLDEKVAQMLYTAPAIERLNIPAYNWWNECLHGVARAGKATVFPQAIGLAATWDTDYISTVSNIISDEGRAKYHEFIRRGKHGMYQGLTFWTPNINIFRDPRWGRGMETYGEDPYLTGQIAIKFIKGIQGDDPNYLKAVATAKHFVVHSGPEPDRHSFNATTDEHDFRETYLPAFRACMVDAKAYSVMCAYNRYNGEACCGSNYLLNEILRDRWNFDGYIVSDCWAIKDFWDGHNIVKNQEEASALAVKSGTDLNCGFAYNGLVEAVKQNLITEAEIDIAVKRLFTARFKLGMFDPDEKVSYSKIPYSVVGSEKHSEAALETARKSIVLLKNENKLLPLKKDVKTVAVIGPNANDVEVLLGNYNGTPSNPITPLQGIKNKLPDANVLFAQGCEHADNLPVMEVIPATAFFTSTDKSEAGLKVEYFNNREFTGEAVHSEIVNNIDVNFWDKAPREDLDDDNFGMRWTGIFVPPISGKYAFGGEGFSGFKIWLDDSLVVKFQDDHHSKKEYKFLEFEAGKSYNLKVDFYNFHGDANMKLLWAMPNKKYKEEAIEIAKKADIVIMMMGLSPRLEGEEMKVEVEGFKGGDRLTLKLPAIQLDLMKSIKALGKPVVLVLLNGSAVAINWADKNIPAIVEAWYPGQAAGTAIADVLFGDYNPAGRLPVTFYKSVDQLPDFSDYNMKGRTYRYFEGDALYDFGYGLSYTTFNYSNLVLPETVNQNKNITVKVDIENTGDMDGDEVVQLYIKDIEASAVVPIQSLQGFNRIHLKKGEKQTVEFTITPRQLSMIDSSNNSVVEAGKFEIIIGGKAPAKGDKFIKGEIEVIGETLEIEY